MAVSPIPTPTQLPTCLIFKLPAELRNRIYEHVLVNKSREEHVLTKRQPPPPVLRTCQQIRLEGSSMYYSQNRLYTYYAEPVTLPWLLSRPVGVLKHLKMLRLCTRSTYAHSWDDAEYKKRLLESLDHALQNAGIRVEFEVLLAVRSGGLWTAIPKLHTRQGLRSRWKMRVTHTDGAHARHCCCCADLKGENPPGKPVEVMQAAFLTANLLEFATACVSSSPPSSAKVLARPFSL